MAEVVQAKKRDLLRLAGKEDGSVDDVRRSGASARFDGTGGEVVGCEENAEEFPAVAEKSRMRSQGGHPYVEDWRM